MCIVAERGIHHPNAQAFPIISLGKLFSVEVRGAFYAWILGMLPKIVSSITYVENA